MNYLAKNLNNSRTLPYDIMKLIYEYADPFIAIRRQIENKEYDLDEIMYQKMIKLINKNHPVYAYANHMSNLTILEMYKGYFFIEYPKICGLNHHNMGYKKYLMILDLQYAKVYKSSNKNYDKYKMNNVYKKWLKL